MQNKYMSINNENIIMSNINLVRLVALILVVLGHSTGAYTKSWVYSANVNSNLYKFFKVKLRRYNTWRLQNENYKEYIITEDSC